jgi:hypothetical protein
VPQSIKGSITQCQTMYLMSSFLGEHQNLYEAQEHQRST